MPPDSTIISKAASAAPRSAIARYWAKTGGGSLLLSISIHMLLLVIAAFVIHVQVHPKAEVDFLAGGGNKQSQAAATEGWHLIGRGYVFRKSP